MMVPPLFQQPLFQCHFSLSCVFFLQLPPLAIMSPLLLPPPSLPHPPSVAVVVPPPLSVLSLLSPPLDICPCVPSSNLGTQWELLFSSLF